ncbi:MAG TPA: cbb3-type cytochrome oxidase assembly protein CcoS [Candidatus Acidoferrum sp.]|nr:cbb3-type cytochrome oxidase assembly protein CcoS [Candidatus Acidoferrum sp.]
MSVILILILASLAVAVAFLGCFVWAVKAGQYEDTCTPAMRILSEDEAVPEKGRGGGNPEGCQDARKPEACATTGPTPEQSHIT